MPNFDDLKLSIEALSGGKNTVLFDDLGMPSVMVPFPKLKMSDLIAGGSGTQNNFSYDFRDKALRTGSESGNYQALGAVAGRKAAPAAKRARGASWKADGQAAHWTGSRQQHDGNNKSSRPFL